MRTERVFSQVFSSSFPLSHFGPTLFHSLPFPLFGSPRCSTQNFCPRQSNLTRSPPIDRAIRPIPYRLPRRNNGADNLSKSPNKLDHFAEGQQWLNHCAVEWNTGKIEERREIKDGLKLLTSQLHYTLLAAEEDSPLYPIVCYQLFGSLREAPKWKMRVLFLPPTKYTFFQIVPRDRSEISAIKRRYFSSRVTKSNKGRLN